MVQSSNRFELELLGSYMKKLEFWAELWACNKLCNFSTSLKDSLYFLSQCQCYTSIFYFRLCRLPTIFIILEYFLWVATLLMLQDVTLLCNSSFHFFLDGILKLFRLLFLDFLMQKPQISSVAWGSSFWAKARPFQSSSFEFLVP